MRWLAASALWVGVGVVDYLLMTLRHETPVFLLYSLIGFILCLMILVLPERGGD